MNNKNIIIKITVVCLLFFFAFAGHYSFFHSDSGFGILCSLIIVPIYWCTMQARYRISEKLNFKIYHVFCFSFIASIFPLYVTDPLFKLIKTPDPVIGNVWTFFSISAVFSSILSIICFWIAKKIFIRKD